MRRATNMSNRIQVRAACPVPAWPNSGLIALRPASFGQLECSRSSAGGRRGRDAPRKTPGRDESGSARNPIGVLGKTGVLHGGARSVESASSSPAPQRASSTAIRSGRVTLTRDANMSRSAPSVLVILGAAQGFVVARSRTSRARSRGRFVVMTCHRRRQAVEVTEEGRRGLVPPTRAPLAASTLRGGDAVGVGRVCIQRPGRRVGNLLHLLTDSSGSRRLHSATSCGRSAGTACSRAAAGADCRRPASRPTARAVGQTFARTPRAGDLDFVAVGVELHLPHHVQLTPCPPASRRPALVARPTPTPRAMREGVTRQSPSFDHSSSVLSHVSRSCTSGTARH